MACDVGLSVHADGRAIPSSFAAALVGVLTAATVIGGHPAVAGDAGAGDGSASPAVTAAVQVTDTIDPTRAHSSPQIAVNPTNGELVIVETNIRGGYACTIRISVDDGRSWTDGGAVMPEDYQDCTPGRSAEYGSYATLEFTHDGTLYVAFVASELPNPHPVPVVQRHVFLARSTDGGRSFDTTMVYQADSEDPTVYINKGPMLAVDPGDPSRVYVGWRQGDLRSDEKKLKTNVAASHDGGGTFAEPVDISDERGGDYPGLAVDPDGIVHAVFWTRSFGVEPEQPGGPPPRPIQYTRSTDGGDTFTEPVEIDPGNQNTSRPPLLAADPSSGQLYMIWYANTEVRNDADGYVGRHDILLRTSRDGGQTWSDRTIVNHDDPSEANQFEPGIAIAPNGRVDIAWYDFRNSPVPPADTTGQGGEHGWSDVYYAFSTDGGETFSTNHRISDRVIDRSVGVWSNNIDSKFNVGVASTDEVVYFAWQDTRNADPDAQAEDVYFATARRAQPAEQAGAGAPNWVLLAVAGAALALGMGLAMLIAWGVTRRGGAMGKAADRT